MAVYVTVSEGDSASSATPLLATRDPRIVTAIARELVRCLGIRDAPSRVLALAGPANEDEASSHTPSGIEDPSAGGDTAGATSSGD